MKILITGCAGFIGSNFTQYILKKYPNYEVIGIDNLTYAGNMVTMDDFINNKRFNFYVVDIADKISLEEIFIKERPDYIVNFAAESHVDRSIKDPEIFIKTNVLGTQVLLDLSLKYGIKRFHQVSTDEVYGDLPIDQPELKFDENYDLKPSSPYSASKASADLLVFAYYRTFQLNTTISRCSNNYGPFQFPEKLIPVMIENALNNKALPVYGTGINIRDWLHVNDHCSAIDKIIHLANPGTVYNIGGNNEFKNIDIVKLILSFLNKDETLISFVKDRKGHDLRYAINSSKIMNDLGWSPSYTFQKGISETIDWFKSNQDWVNEVKKGK